MSDKNELIRKPAVAGQFYESDPGLLNDELSILFANCADSEQCPDGKKVRAIISPHAGYLYSGQSAAKVFALFKKNFNYKRVVVIAPSHRLPFSGLATSTYTVYQTPLGDIPVDTEISEQLSRSPVISMRNQAHEYEHALEVQLPFLQKITENLPISQKIKIVPLICGALDSESAKLAAEALLPYWNPETLWIISSDFTHYGGSFGYLPFRDNIPENLKKLDLGAVEYITNLDFKGFSDYIEQTGATICGANPVKLLLKCIEISRQDDKVTAQLIDYTTSGELTGDYSHCVSYAGIAFNQKV